MTLDDFNDLSKEEAGIQLFSCCSSHAWKKAIMEKFPFKDEMDLLANAEMSWYKECNEADWMEAFTHHPKIGDVKSLAEKFAATKHLAGKEQAEVEKASAETIHQLVAANREYEARFGFIFIVSATGKTADEMLRLLKDRLKNNLIEELCVAMGEQHKITVFRLQKILDKANWKFSVNQVTTHVLDTSAGIPGNNITIRLKQLNDEIWETIAQGVTNADGRIADLLPQGRIIDPGNYKMVFETGDYFVTQNIKGFYPQVDIQFTVFDNKHYHVPLLINPFGYTTYRGS